MTTTDCGCPEFRTSRRRLLGGIAAGAALGTVSQLIGDAHRQVAFGAEPGGNVVVVLSLRGGADGLSLVVPRGADHDLLAAARPNLVVPESVLLGDDPRFGFHPALAPLMPFWQAGVFGAVHAVGLSAPNRSHFDATEEMEDADPGTVSRVGWINRMTGLSASPLPEDAVALGVPLAPASLVGPAPALSAYDLSDLAMPEVGTSAQTRRTALTRAWGSSTTPLAAGVRTAIGVTQRLSPLVDAVDSNVHTLAYPEGPLQQVLASTAALIRADLGTRIVAIDYGDWDMHADLGRVDGGWMVDQATHFASSLAAFMLDLGTAASRVTVVTLTEFGRRVEENGSGGVDHGYGNATFLLGAGVNGGAVHGRWPGLAQLEDGDLALGQDYRSVLWEVLGSRFSDLSGSRSTIFPGFTPEAVGAMA